MIDRKLAGVRCRTVQHIVTREGLLRGNACGTICYEINNLDRCLILVEWDNGMNIAVFPEEIAIVEQPEHLAA
jgi:hypothetical protein